MIDASSQRVGDLGAYVYAILAANKEVAKGDTKMGNLVKTLFENPSFAEEVEKLGYIDSTESAKRLLKSGVGTDIVADSLGLPLSRVKKIKAELDAAPDTASTEAAEAKV